MGATSALSDAADALRRNPVVLAGALLVAAAAAVALRAAVAVGGAVPLAALGLVAGYLLVEPLLAGGFLGMADAAVAGETDLGAFRTHAVANYVDLLAARLVVGVLVVAVAGLAVAATLALGVSMVPDPGSGPAMHDPLAGVASLLAGAVLVVVVLGPPVVLGHVLLQFYPAGVVVGDAGPVESFGYSVRLVRRHPLSALGYTLVALVGGGALGAAAGGLVDPVGGGSVPAGDVARGPEAPVGSVVVASVAGAVRVALVRTYYVAFVRSVAE